MKQRISGFFGDWNFFHVVCKGDLICDVIWFTDRMEESENRRAGWGKEEKILGKKVHALHIVGIGDGNRTCVY